MHLVNSMHFPYFSHFAWFINVFSIYRQKSTSFNDWWYILFVSFNKKMFCNDLPLLVYKIWGLILRRVFKRQNIFNWMFILFDFYFIIFFYVHASSMPGLTGSWFCLYYCIIKLFLAPFPILCDLMIVLDFMASRL